jgi:hypothetical protein
MRLFPYDPYMAFNLAEAYREAGMCAPALPLYRWSRELEPDINGRTEYSWCLLDQGEYTESKRMALEAVRAGGRVKLLHEIIAADDTAMMRAQGHDSVGKTRVTGAGRLPSKLPESVQKAVGKASASTP